MSEHQKQVSVLITQEMADDLQHCIERTDCIWQPEVDYWPLTLLDILKKFDEGEDEY